MDWTLDLNIVLEVASICVLAGMTYQSIQTLKRDVEKLEKEIMDFRDLKAELAVIKTELKQLNSNFQRYLEEAE